LENANAGVSGVVAEEVCRADTISIPESLALVVRSNAAVKAG